MKPDDDAVDALLYLQASGVLELVPHAQQLELATMVAMNTRPVSPVALRARAELREQPVQDGLRQYATTMRIAHPEDVGGQPMPPVAYCKCGCGLPAGIARTADRAGPFVPDRYVNKMLKRMYADGTDDLTAPLAAKPQPAQSFYCSATLMERDKCPHCAMADGS